MYDLDALARGCETGNVSAKKFANLWDLLADHAAAVMDGGRSFVLPGFCKFSLVGPSNRSPARTTMLRAFALDAGFQTDYALTAATGPTSLVKPAVYTNYARLGVAAGLAKDEVRQMLRCMISRIGYEARHGQHMVLQFGRVGQLCVRDRRVTFYFDRGTPRLPPQQQTARSARSARNGPPHSPIASGTSNASRRNRRSPRPETNLDDDADSGAEPVLTVRSTTVPQTSRSGQAGARPNGVASARALSGSRRSGRRSGRRSQDGHSGRRVAQENSNDAASSTTSLVDIQARIPDSELIDHEQVERDVEHLSELTLLGSVAREKHYVPRNINAYTANMRHAKRRMSQRLEALKRQAEREDSVVAAAAETRQRRMDADKRQRKKKEIQYLELLAVQRSQDRVRHQKELEVYLSDHPDYDHAMPRAKTFDHKARVNEEKQWMELLKNDAEAAKKRKAAEKRAADQEQLDYASRVLRVAYRDIVHRADEGRSRGPREALEEEWAEAHRLNEMHNTYATKI